MCLHCIPLDQYGLQVVHFFLCKDNSLHPSQISFILQCIDFMITHNYFTSMGQFNRRVRGTAMGARFVPRCANLFMNYWEQHHIWTNNPYRANLVQYSSYIDEILIIWDGSGLQLEQLLCHCQSNLLDEETLVFLDLELRADTDTRIVSNSF